MTTHKDRPHDLVSALEVALACVPSGHPEYTRLSRVLADAKASPVTPAAKTVAVPDEVDALRKQFVEFMRGATRYMVYGSAAVGRACNLFDRATRAAALSAPATPAKVEDDVARDAERFRAIIAAVVKSDEAFIDEFSRLCPGDPTSLGHARLVVDGAMLSAAQAKEGKP